MDFKPFAKQSYSLSFILSTYFVWVYIPETKGMVLEEIRDKLFDRSNEKVTEIEGEPFISPPKDKGYTNLYGTNEMADRGFPRLFAH